MNELEEVWKEIKGFADYKVSNFGRVKSYKDGSEKILKLQPNHKNYLMIRLYKNNKQYTFGIHRIVCMHFNGDRSNEIGLQVNHIDGNKSNNRSDNLEWCTNQENAIHAFKLKLRRAKKGSEVYNSKLTEEIVLKILELLDTTTLSCNKIGKMFGVSKDCVYDLARGKSWVHLTGGKLRQGRKIGKKNSIL